MDTVVIMSGIGIVLVVVVVLIMKSVYQWYTGMSETHKLLENVFVAVRDLTKVQLRLLEASTAQQTEPDPDPQIAAMLARIKESEAGEKRG